MFRCPKCSFTVPFNIVVNGQAANVSGSITNSDETLSTGAGTSPGSVPTQNDAGTATRVVTGLQDKTRVVEGLAGDTGKTRMVAGLQPKARGVFVMTYAGRSYGVVNLPHGNFYNLGRNSSDGTAQIKLTPDRAMSRIHAGMRTVVSPMGQVQFQITSAKDDNPVYVNNVPIRKGKPCTLNNGDTVRMGETTLLFKQM